MANTHAAADELQGIVDGLHEQLDTMMRILEHLELDGTEDTTALEENLKRLKNNIDTNVATIAHIRATAE